MQTTGTNLELRRHGVRGALTGAAVALLICSPWEVALGVGRPIVLLILPLVPLMFSFALVGALLGLILSLARGEKEPRTQTQAANAPDEGAAAIEVTSEKPEQAPGAHKTAA